MRIVWFLCSYGIYFSGCPTDYTILGAMSKKPDNGSQTALIQADFDAFRYTREVL